MQDYLPVFDARTVACVSVAHPFASWRESSLAHVAGENHCDTQRSVASDVPGTIF